MVERDLTRAKALLASAEKLYRTGDLAGVAGLAYQAFESAVMAFNKIVKGKDVASHQRRMQTAREIFSERADDLKFLWNMRNIDFYGDVSPGDFGELQKERVEKVLVTVREIIEKTEKMVKSK